MSLARRHLFIQFSLPVQLVPLLSFLLRSSPSRQQRHPRFQSWGPVSEDFAKHSKIKNGEITYCMQFIIAS